MPCPECGRPLDAKRACWPCCQRLCACGRPTSKRSFPPAVPVKLPPPRPAAYWECGPAGFRPSNLPFVSCRRYNASVLCRVRVRELRGPARRGDSAERNTSDGPRLQTDLHENRSRDRRKADENAPQVVRRVPRRRRPGAARARLCRPQGDGPAGRRPRAPRRPPASRDDRPVRRAFPPAVGRTPRRLPPHPGIQGERPPLRLSGRGPLRGRLRGDRRRPAVRPRRRQGGELAGGTPPQRHRPRHQQPLPPIRSRVHRVDVPEWPRRSRPAQAPVRRQRQGGRAAAAAATWPSTNACGSCERPRLPGD